MRYIDGVPNQNRRRNRGELEALSRVVDPMTQENDPPLWDVETLEAAASRRRAELAKHYLLEADVLATNWYRSQSPHKVAQDPQATYSLASAG